MTVPVLFIGIESMPSTRKRMRWTPIALPGTSAVMIDGASASAGDAKVFGAICTSSKMTMAVWPGCTCGITVTVISNDGGGGCTLEGATVIDGASRNGTSFVAHDDLPGRVTLSPNE